MTWGTFGNLFGGSSPKPSPPKAIGLAPYRPQPIMDKTGYWGGSGGGYIPTSPAMALAQANADYLRNSQGFLFSGGGYGGGGGGYGGGGGGLTADQQRQLLNFDIFENALKTNQGYDIDKMQIEARNKQLASQGRVIDLNQQLIGRDLSSLTVDEGGINRAIALQRKLMGYDTQEFQNRQAQNQLAIQGTQWESGLGQRELNAQTSLGLEKAGFGQDIGLRRINWNQAESLRKLGSDAAARGAGTTSGYRHDILNTNTQAGFDREELMKQTGFTRQGLLDQQRFGIERLQKAAEFKIKDIELQQKILAIQHQASQATSQEQINKYGDDLQKLQLQRETLFLQVMKNNEARESLGGDLIASAAAGQQAELNKLLGQTNDARLQYQLSLIQ